MKRSEKIMKLADHIEKENFMGLGRNDAMMCIIESAKIKYPSHTEVNGDTRAYNNWFEKRVRYVINKYSGYSERAITAITVGNLLELMEY